MTVRQLLSFTSGFDDGEQAGGGDSNATTCSKKEKGQWGGAEVAREIDHRGVNFN